MSDLSTRPYLIRAIYEWCVDSGLTPYLAVRVDEHTEVPRSHVKDGEIVLNLSADAVRNLQMGKDAVPLMKYAERLFSRQGFIDALTASERAMRK